MPALHLVAHAALASLMVVLLVVAAVLARRKKAGWMPRHRAIAGTGIALGLAGVVTMAVAKWVRGWPHLATPHSKVALAAVILVLAAPVLGTLVLKGGRALRTPHRAVGAAAILASAAAAVMGLLMVLT